MALEQKKYLDQTGLTAFWNRVKEYINAGDTNAGNLSLEYTNDKKIALKRGAAIISSFDASDFIKDSFLQSGEIVEKEVGGKKKQTLRLTLITVERPGETGTTQTVDIDVDKLFSQNASDIKMADGKTVQVALTDLDAAYKAADTALDGKIDDLDAAYKAADTALDGKITALDTAYKAADAALDGKIATLNGKVADLEFADTTLGERIDGVVVDYKAADTAVYNAITAIPLEDINSLFAEGGA